GETIVWFKLGPSGVAHSGKSVLRVQGVRSVTDDIVLLYATARNLDLSPLLLDANISSATRKATPLGLVLVVAVQAGGGHYVYRSTQQATFRPMNSNGGQVSGPRSSPR
ncbi:MAG: hypothetical protein ABSE73_31120, partial [Planctomycetota bacterium]